MPSVSLEIVNGNMTIAAGREYLNWRLIRSDEALLETNMGITLFYIDPMDGRIRATQKKSILEPFVDSYLNGCGLMDL